MTQLEMSLADRLPLARIREICRCHGVEELAIFGSALRGDLRSKSDVDFLVRFQPGKGRPWLAHFQALEEDLSSLLGRPVDLIDRRSVEKSRNWIRRKAILESAQVVYAA